MFDFMGGCILESVINLSVRPSVRICVSSCLSVCPYEIALQIELN